MTAMPPTAITVAELPVEPDALQAFALEQNRLACVLWEHLEALQHQIAQANRARFGVSSERLMGQAELFDATAALPVSRDYGTRSRWRSAMRYVTGRP
jgi:transposase